MWQVIIVCLEISLIETGMVKIIYMYNISHASEGTRNLFLINTNLNLLEKFIFYDSSSF